MANFVKVRIRATFWSSLDPVGEIIFRDGGLAESNNILTGANFVSGPRSPYEGGFFATNINGPESGPVDEEFVFVIPPGELPNPAECMVVFAFGYDSYEVDIYLSEDNVSYTLAGTGDGTVSGGTEEWFALTQTDPVVDPFWTQFVLTREEGVS